ncbi:MAG: MFS transporter [Cyanothece sp. SIO2G6]|nr:MFS transporter [Cyanothece sp. SIO2G6]
MNKRNTQIVLFLSVFVDILCGTIVVPLIPFYGQEFGASAATITLIFSIQSLMALLTSAFWGSLSDRFGRRPLLLFSLFATSSSCLWFGFLPGLWALFVCMGLIGAFSGSAQVATAYVADTTTPEKRTQAIGNLQAAFGVGMIAGPLLGGILVGIGSTNPNFSLPCMAAALIGFSALIFAFFVLPESLPKERRMTEQSSENQAQSQSILGSLGLGETLQNPLTRVLLVGVFFAVFAVSCVQPTLGIWASEELNWGPQHVSYLYAYWGVVGVLIQVTVLGLLTKRFGEINLFVWGLFIYSAGLALIPFSRSLIWLLPPITLGCLGFSLARVVLFSLLSQSASARRQGQIQSIAGLSMSLAGISAPMLSGYVYNAWGSSWPFWIGPIFLVVSMILIMPVINRSRLSLARTKRRDRTFSQLFRMLDYDRNGAIEIQDFEQIVTNLAELRNWSASSSEYKTIYSFWMGLGETLQAAVDTDGDGKISEMEWLDYMGKGLDIDFAEAFSKLLDTDQDGQICVSELMTFYQLYKADTSLAEQQFAIFDTNRDGYISSEEIRETFKHFMYGETLDTQKSFLLGI